MYVFTYFYFTTKVIRRWYLDIVRIYTRMYIYGLYILFKTIFFRTLEMFFFYSFSMFSAKIIIRIHFKDDPKVGYIICILTLPIAYWCQYVVT